MDLITRSNHHLQGLMQFLLLVLQVFACEALSSQSPSAPIDKGINRLFNFSIPNSSCNYTVSQPKTLPYIICDPQFSIHNNGYLLYKHDTWRSFIKECDRDLVVTVKAVDCFSFVNVSFTVHILRANLNVNIPFIEIDVDNNNDSKLDLKRINIFQWKLKALLPPQVVQISNSSITNSKLSELFINWYNNHDSQISNTASLGKGINVRLRVQDPQSDVLSRKRRQVFSNLHNPKFSKGAYSASINEEISIGTEILQIIATDEDAGSSGTVEYSLQADVDQRSLNLFDIDSDTGLVSTKGRIDRESISSHQFTVQARDKGSPPNMAQVSLTITVLDVNDHAPSFEFEIYNINVSETESVDSIVTHMRAEDEDAGQNKEIKYWIVNSQLVPDFTINRNTGDLTIAKPLNRESSSEYSFVVKAVDQSDNIADRRTSTVTVNIQVVDFNDNAPKFSQTAYTFEVLEDIDITSGPKTIGQVLATDADFAKNGIVRYSITFGNQYQVFEIDAETGDLRVIVPLDRDKRGGDEYNLRVRAKDSGSPSLSNVVNVKVVVLDVNDNPPAFRHPSYFYNVFEDHVPGNPIATIEADDPDKGDNQLLKYSIIYGHGKGELPITINENTGVITNNATLDRETTARYEFQVKVQDGGIPQLSAAANVTITILDRNDNKPKFSKDLYSVLISEDAEILDEVITVTAEDPDENDELTYSIINGDSTNDFSIIKEQRSGIIRVNKKLSYERKKIYSLKIRATDSSAQSSDCTVQVNVTDKNMYTPVFEKDVYEFSVPESTGKGATIGTIQAKDADIELNGQVTYFFISNGQPLPFRISLTTGEVIVNDTLDRDNPLTQEFYVDVIARDRGLPPLETPIPAVLHVVVLDINDNAPKFGKAEYTASIAEDESVGSSVITLSASDDDKPGTDNSQVRYTFDGGNNGNGSFYIEYSGGTIRVNKSLDRETKSEYQLVVYATDMAPLSQRKSSSVTVKVTVRDVNDNAPQFESDTIVRRIFENQPLRSVVSPVIRATDADLGDYAKITFQLVGGDVNAFELKDLNDGSFQLLSKVLLDYESLKKNYTLQVQASSEHMITKATVIVKLQDINDNRPVLQDFSIIVNNYRGYFPSGYIGRVPAFDPDESDRENLRYAVKTNNEAEYFTLNSTTGYIKLNKDLGSNVNHVVEFVIQVSDLRNTVNATCKLIYRFITADMLTNSVTLRLDDLTPVAFMTHMYKYTVQALAAVLEVKASSVYVIDIKEDTEVNTDIHNPVLNISFAAVQEEDGRDAYLSQGHIKEQIYRRLDLLKNLSAVTALPFDDTLCINEPCINYAKCSVTLEFSEAVPFLISNTLLFRPIRSKKLFSCNCPTGLAGQNTTYSCDTEVNLCYSNPCLNLGTCVQIEGGFRCICPTGYKGERCEYNTMIAVYNASYCPNEVCTGEGAYCVDLIRGGFACHQGAVRCVETDTRTDTCTTRTVSFVSGSYLMFPALQSRIRFNIQLSFATRKKSGLLLYNGRYNHLHDFIALQLIDHKAVLKMSFANQTYSVSVGNKYGLNDGHWHTIEVDYKDATLTISLDQCDVGLNLIHPELFDPPCAQRIEIKECRRLPRGEDQRCALDVTGPLLVGGLPDHFSLDSLRVSSSNLVGCIRDLYINYKHMDFGAAVSKYNTQDGCVYKRDFCITLPCRNKGTCISSWATYQCLCPEERSGRDCSKKIGPSSSFYGIGYLKYATSLDAVGKPWYNSFSFRTTTDYKLIMRVELEQGKTVEYKMERGYITFRYAGFYYVFDEALVNDDRWHHFEMRYLTNSRGQGQILLQLDYGDLQRSEPLDNSLDGLRVQAVWVGGDTSVGRENLGYAGCIKDVSIGSSISLQTLDSPTVRHHVFDGCSKPTTCETPCRAGANSKCEIGWENSTCLCNEGLYGASCSSVCSSKYNPCQHGGKCRVDRETALGYKCVCATGYEGNYCEDKLNTQCAASWWGGPVCVPCSCDVSLNFNSQCNTVTGACTCKTGFFKPSSSDRCVPCDCYYSAGKGGATSLSCDPGTGQCECRSGVTGRMCDRCDNPFAEATADGCVVRYDSCPKSYMDDVWWTRTKFGIVRIETCPSGSVGNATRTCKDNKLGWQQPVLSGCTSLLFLALNESLVELEGRREGNSSEPVVPVTSSRYTFLATHIISSLKNATQQVEKLYRNDLLIALRILRQILLREKVGQAFDLTHTQDLYFMENLVDVTSFVLNPDYTDYWVSIVDTYKSTVLTDLLRDYDEYMANLALNMATKFKSTEMKPFQITTKNMVLAVDTIRSNGVVIPKYNNIKKNDSIFDDVTSAELPPALFSARADGSLVDDRTVSCVILYRTAAELLTSTSDSENDPYTPSVELNDGVYSGPTYGGIILNSPILSLVVQQGSSKPKLLDESIEITFFLRIQEQTLNPQCVYLDDTGKWTSELCQVDTIKDDRVVCSCQHLSTYALITDYNSNLGAVFNHVGVHMYIAVAFSLFCLLLTLAVFVCLRHEKSNYIYIQINALVCFCVSLIIFVSGSDSSANQAACTLVAVLLQFFVLSLFAWAFVNAFHLYRMFTEVRSIDGGTMLLYVLIGYVAPGVVTGLSIGLNPEEFGTQSLCWLNLYKPMIWSLAGPVLFCCVSIEVFLILCIVTNCRRHTTTSAIRKKDIPKFKSAIWISVASLPLTLCTWLFALLTVNTPPTLTRSHDYVFSVFTCMTALFNLLAHVVFSKQGRTELRKRWKSCQGHGRLEESETSDKPVHGVFGEREGGYAFGYGSESSTTSNSRLTSQSSDLMAQIRYGHSSTSSDIPTFSQSGGGRSRRRRRPISDCSSDSETDSEIRTEREKDIELASSHSSDEDDAITPAARHTLPANELPTKPHSTPIGEEETIFAPPPPNFATPSNTFSRRLSVSTDSTDPFQHNADSSYTNLSFNQPTNFLTFTGGPKKVTPPPFLDQSQQHMNPSFVNSPSFPEKLMAGTAQSPTVSDEVLSSIERTSRASSDKTQPTNHNSQALVGQHHVSAAATREDADSIHTQSTTKSTQEEMFIPPPPRLSFHLSVQPSSGSASSSVTKTDAALAAADAAILDDVNNETQV